MISKYIFRILTIALPFLIFLISIANAKDCSIKIIQNGQEIIPISENKIPTYKLKSSTFRIEVGDTQCNPGIFWLDNEGYKEYLQKTPLVLSVGGYGLAEGSESIDIFGTCFGGDDPRTTVDDEIHVATNDIELAINKYNEICAELKYCPTPARTTARYWPFVYSKTTSGSFAEFKRNIPAGIKCKVVVYTTYDKVDLFDIVKPNIMVLDFQPWLPDESSFPAAELKFRKFFAERAGDKAIYCLLGNGYIRTITSGEEDSAIKNWLNQHPNAKAIPVSISGEGSKNPMVYIWIVDGSENLNLLLIRQGVFPASVMIDAVHFEALTKNSPERAIIEAGYRDAEKYNPNLKTNITRTQTPPRRLIADANYQIFLRELVLSDEMARKQKIGIWSNKFKALRGEYNETP